ncbi:MAG: ABC transporter ATP-binding protein [Paracoccus sp. (in: a-proteobacteria)]|uniref:ABC transporter ATP-binding protein n=1 Tax=Paracoccus sp. TaxID=267 RepID=UPI0039193A4E
MQTNVSVRNLRLDYGTVSVLKDLDLDIGKGEFLVLLGSSGCGKSTLLNCIAGLLEPTDGSIFINGTNVTWAEPSERGIGMVFQSYALYPQMTVEGNLTFGLKNAKLPRDEIRRRVDRAAEMLQIQPLLKRKPAALSGGQRQRVAIGRALVRDVDVFLFDEPLSNLDAKLRAELRVEIKRLHQQLGNTMIYVTHDQIEAMTLADRIAIMRGGVVLQLASPDEIYNRPAHKYVADFIGAPPMNFVAGRIDSDGPRVVRVGDLVIPLDGYAFARPGHAGPVWFGMRPEHVLTGDAAAQAPVRLDLRAELVEPMGAETLVWSSLAGVPFKIRLDGQVRVATGDVLPVGLDPARASIFDQADELRV